VSDEFDSEPIPGLPEYLPAGENLLWQGSPSWTSLARHSMHAGKVALYFALLSACRVLWNTANGAAFSLSLTDAAPVFGFGMVGVALLCLVAWLSSRTTIYSITDRRVVMRYGIALPMTVNIPFCEIAAADFKTYSDGTGDLALAVNGPMRLAYLHLWPNVRPWQLKVAQPAIRSIPKVPDVAQLLATQVSQAVPAARTVSKGPVSRTVKPDVRSQPSNPSFAGVTA
jgi:Bacterial PH domain